MIKNTNAVCVVSKLSVQRNMPHLLLRSDALALIIGFIAKSVSLKHYNESEPGCCDEEPDYYNTSIPRVFCSEKCKMHYYGWDD